MLTIQDIRRANLALLLEECRAEIGSDRGAQALLARYTGVPAPIISQFLARKLHQGGKERKLGDDVTAKLECGMEKPRGWMDVDRATATDASEATFVDMFRGLNDAQRKAIIASMQAFLGELSTPKRKPAPPQGKAA